MRKLHLLFVVGAFLFTACKKEYPPIGDVSSQIEGISDSWTLSKVNLIDLAGILPEERDITFFFEEASEEVTSITFNSENFTYAAFEPSGYIIFGSSGSWSFDDPRFPTEITITPDDNAISVFTISLSSPVREVDSQLKFQLKDKCGADDVAANEFEYNRN